MSKKDPELKAGMSEAAKVLAHLPPENREKVMEIMRQKDPELTEELKKKMLVFEDLICLTTNMLQELLREIKIEDLGLALRVSSEELKEHILSNVSSRLKQDIMDVLKGPPVEVTKVHDAAERILSIVRKKVEDGTIVLVHEDHDEYV